MRLFIIAVLVAGVVFPVDPRTAAQMLFARQISTGFAPLTTVFTPAPECSSLTIVHQQRYVAVYSGCVGVDPSCCPQTGRLNNTWSPGVCPSGYVTTDPHVGLDRLAIDTMEWEATCIPKWVPLLSIIIETWSNLSVADPNLDMTEVSRAVLDPGIGYHKYPSGGQTRYVHALILVDYPIRQLQ
jgi:hypothetical protein